MCENDTREGAWRWRGERAVRCEVRVRCERREACEVRGVCDGARRKRQVQEEAQHGDALRKR